MKFDYVGCHSELAASNFYNRGVMDEKDWLDCPADRRERFQAKKGAFIVRGSKNIVTLKRRWRRVILHIGKRNAK